MAYEKLRLHRIAEELRKLARFGGFAEEPAAACHQAAHLLDAMQPIIVGTDPDKVSAEELKEQFTKLRDLTAQQGEG